MRSLSGGTDILVLVTATITTDIERVFYNGDSGLNRKSEWLNDLQLKNDLKEGLIGFHAFTGNDFFPVFFFEKARRSVGTRWLEILNL